MPFITEEIWHTLYDGNPPAKSIALTTYPTGNKPLTESSYDPNIFEMQTVQNVVTAFRILRKENGVPDKEFVRVN